MKKISRKEAIWNMGGLALIPFIPGFIKSKIGERGGDITDAAYNVSDNLPVTNKMILKPFAYSEVKTNNGSLNRQIEYIKNYYLDIPNDDLLKGFRKRVGLPDYGARDLGGWYTPDIFHIFGQLLSGYSRLYAVTGDEQCKDKTGALIDGWAECIDSDGYFYYTEHPNVHYVYDKMVGGLVDAYIFTGNDQALIYLSTITDWAIKNLDRRKPYANILKEGGFANVEWYTLSENLYRAYQVTKNQKYFDFARHWEYTEYWNLYAEKKSIFTKEVHYHAYSHLNTLSGAAMAYTLKGDGHYLDTLKNAYDFFQEEECFATGGFGPDESLLPKGKLIETLKDTHKTFETQCGSWAAFKLCKYLMLFTGNARYGDWIEKLIYNGAGADIPLSPDGKVLYYSDYNPREGQKRNFYEGWACCNGTRPQAVAEYAHLIYFHNEKGIFVNLYTPSHVEWNNIQLTQTTRFPETRETIFTINLLKNPSEVASLYFRKPGWLTGSPELSINGKPTHPIVADNWINITRDWKDGDEVKLSFPMQLGIDRLDKAKEYPASIVYGPVVMAIRSGEAYPEDLLKKQNPFTGFIPVAGSPLTWHVKDMPQLLIKPYYTYKENERYILYIDPAVKNRILQDDLVMKGNWTRDHGTGFFTSNEKGATITANFRGNGVRLYLNGNIFSGKGQVWIDQKLVDTIDEYSSTSTSFQKEYKGLKDGEHAVSVKVLGEKNERSKATFVNVNWVEVLETVK